jgi:hypothetical protein
MAVASFVRITCIIYLYVGRIVTQKLLCTLYYIFYIITRCLVLDEINFHLIYREYISLY